jgi:hypothetical protein
VEQSLGAVAYLSMPVPVVRIGKVLIPMFQRLVPMRLRTLCAVENYFVMGMLLI